MATFEAKVYKLTIEPHPNADKLELAAVGDYRAVVQKDIYKTGDLGVYIQEGSIVPKWLLDRYGWKLAGPDANRVKAMKLRSILSQGIVVPVSNGIDVHASNGNFVMAGLYLETGPNTSIVVHEGMDCAELLGVTKYEPPIPVHMAGEVTNAFGHTISYDIENIKKFPDVLVDGEEVVMTEKLHGTWTCFGYNPNFGDIVTSKGMSGQGLVFKLDVEANRDNLYIRALRATEYGVEIGFDEDTEEDIVETQNVIERAAASFDGLPFYILGETFGKGVQDLTYGTTKPEFRAFDIYRGEPGKGCYMSYDDLVRACDNLGLEVVPLVYRGPYSKAKLVEVTNGTETLSGKAANIREGVVVKPVVERRNELIGRVQLKSVSDAYLLRKGDATELA